MRIDNRRCAIRSWRVVLGPSRKPSAPVGHCRLRDCRLACRTYFLRAVGQEMKEVPKYKVICSIPTWSEWDMLLCEMKRTFDVHLQVRKTTSVVSTKGFNCIYRIETQCLSMTSRSSLFRSPEPLQAQRYSRYAKSLIIVRSFSHTSIPSVQFHLPQQSQFICSEVGEKQQPQATCILHFSSGFFEAILTILTFSECSAVPPSSLKLTSFSKNVQTSSQNR